MMFIDIFYDLLEEKKFEQKKIFGAERNTLYYSNWLDQPK